MASDPSRPVGRPRKPLAEKLVPVSTNLMPREYDALCREAQARGVSVSEIVREAVYEASRETS